MPMLSPVPVQKLCLALLLPALTSLIGCGIGGTSTKPVLAGTTNVTILLSSTANDLVTSFNIGVTGVTLVSKDNVARTLTPANPNANPEFIHLNGSSEPLLTGTIPQDVYTSAIVNVSSAGFSCSSLFPSGAAGTSFDFFPHVPASQVTVSLPAAITVTGSAMTLQLSLAAAKSISLPSCTALMTSNVNPTFTLTRVAFSGSSDPTEYGANGVVNSVSSAA